jgi:predicted component of type VI protein secretion system
VLAVRERHVQARLRVIGGEEQTRQIELHLPAIVGRSRTTDVTLFHPLVSRQHCEIFEADGRLMVRDLGSLNGTFVGELRLAEAAVPLEPGERLTVGCITLLADYQPPATASSESGASWSSGGPTIESADIDSSGNSNGESLRFDAGHTPRPSSRVQPRSRD